MIEKSRSGLRLHVAELTDFSVALIVLAELAPERTTMAQMSFFLLAALADAKGSPETFTDIRERVGPVIGKSLHTTYQVFLDKPRKRSDSDKVSIGLGWLTREEDPEDNRKKYMRLTERGWTVLIHVAEAIGKGA